ncbi:MAG: hypothetical protein WD772_10500 [Pseudohongiellaceae bacterium]
MSNDMSFKPVILIYDLKNTLVDEIAATIGATGQYTTINTYNEGNAQEAVRQYDRLFGVLTNKLSCVITGWNHHKKRRDQFLFWLRSQERRSKLRKPTPVILVSEDHLPELKHMALDPADGDVAAYLDSDQFRESLNLILRKIVIEGKARELNSVAYAEALNDEA